MSRTAESSIAVVGAGGFIGAQVCDELLDHGYSVTGLSVSEHPVGNRGLVTTATPHGTVDEFQRAFADHRIVIHLAARSGGISFQRSQHAAIWEENTRLTNNVLKAASASGCERIFLASSAVIYAESDKSLTENDRLLSLPERPSGYAWSKITDEVLGAWHALESPIDVTVGRFTNIYGASRQSSGTVIEDLAHRARALDEGQPLVVWGNDSTIRSFVHVKDAARAVRQIAIAGEGTYNVDTGKGITIGRLAEMIRSRFCPHARVQFDRSKPSGLPHRVLDPTRLMEEGWLPQVKLEDGLDEYLA